MQIDKKRIVSETGLVCFSRFGQIQRRHLAIGWHGSLVQLTRTRHHEHKGKKDRDSRQQSVCLSPNCLLCLPVRAPEQVHESLRDTVLVPASPCATLALAQAVCARAFLHG